MSYEEDKKSVEKILRNNKEAVDLFYKKFKPPLTSFVKKRISDPNDAEDIVHEALLSALNSLSTFCFKSSLFSWLCSIAKHETIDFYRRKKIKTVLFSAIPSLEEIHDKALGPEGKYLKNELKREIFDTFPKLNKGYSKILRLKYIEKLKMKQIAYRLKTTVKSVESKLFRARKKFKNIWRKNH